MKLNFYNRDMFALHKDFNSQAKTDDRFIKQEMKSRKDLIVFVRSM